MSRDTEKLCYVCEDMKPLYYFHKNDRSPDGYTNLCKSCHYNRQKAWKRHRKTWTHKVNRLLAGWGR